MTATATAAAARRKKRRPAVTGLGPEPGPRRVAIYLRRSTDDEHQPFSIEAQQAARWAGGGPGAGTGRSGRPGPRSRPRARLASWGRSGSRRSGLRRSAFSGSGCKSAACFYRAYRHYTGLVLYCPGFSLPFSLLSLPCS